MVGGYFFGVEEHSKDNPVAGAFPGISNNEVDGALQSLRHSAADHLNPTPFFETTVLRGPCAENGLAEGRAIVAVEISQSHTTPHVHKDGRIYRRIADGSEPKPETDRFVLDQLWRRSEPIREMTRKWIERDPEFSQETKEPPYVRVLLCVDPWYQRDPWLGASLHEIRRILTSYTPEGIPSISFDTVYTTTGEIMAGGIIARQLKGNDPHRYGLTWKLQRDLSCDIALPLSLYAPNAPEDLLRGFDGYQHAGRFVHILKEQEHTQPRVADLNFLMYLLIGIVSKYRRLLNLTDTEGKFYFKARTLNAGRIIPFVDDEKVLGEFEAYGSPMILDSTVTVPPGDDPDSFAFIDELETKEDKYKEQVVTVTQASLMFTRIAVALGIPIVIEGEAGTEDTVISYPQLKAVGDRALTVQQNRNKRRAGA